MKRTISNKRKVKFGVMIFVALLAVLAFIGCGSATTHYVNPGGSIQAVVNAASDGDMIIVREGVYTENVDVNKRLTIRSKNGYASTIVQAAILNDHVFKVTTDYVNISGFTIEDALIDRKAGIYLYDVEHCTVSNNTAVNNWRGIYLKYSTNNILINNNASNNEEDGIFLGSSDNNILRDNNISNNIFGIFLGSSNNNILANNNLNSNNLLGIYLETSSNNTLINNTMSENNHNFGIRGEDLSEYIQNIDTGNKVDGEPIYYLVNQQNKQIPYNAGYVGVVNSTNITVKDLTLINNEEGVLLAFSTNSIIENVNASSNGDGIYLWRSSNNILKNNNASNNEDGICLGRSSNNILTKNTANSNSYYGIYLTSSSNKNTITSNNVLNNRHGIYLSFSSNNKIYINNFINNRDNVYSGSSTNTWNSTEKITYIYTSSRYTNYLGNYWSDCKGIDTNEDGVGDYPYCIPNDNADIYPLREQYDIYVTKGGKEGIIGFEAIFAIAGLLVVAYLLGRRRLKRMPPNLFGGGRLELKKRCPRISKNMRGQKKYEK